jgi:hypothetical protein
VKEKTFQVGDLLIERRPCGGGHTYAVIEVRSYNLRLLDLTNGEQFNSASISAIHTLVLVGDVFRVSGSDE